MPIFDAALLGKDQGLLSALAKLADGWPKLSSVNDGRSLADFLQAGRGRFKTDAVRAAVKTAKLDKDYDVVVAALDTVWDIVDDFQSSPLAPLLDRLDRFSTPGATPDTGLVAWTPLQADGATSAGPFAITIAANAGVAFDADDRWPVTADRAADPDLDLLLSVRAAGAVDATARAKWPFPLGSASVGATARLAPSATCYFAPRDRSQLFGAVLAESLAALPNPLDLTSVWKAAQTSDFKGAIVTLDGGFSIDGEIAIAATGDLQGLKIGATVAVSAGISRQTGMTLAVRALPPRGGIRPLALTIGRKRGGASSLGVRLAIEIDPTALTARVTTAVNRALDWQDQRLASIKPFLTPGTLLQQAATDRIGSVIADAGLRDALLADLTSASADAATGINDWLAGLLTDALDANVGRVLDTANAEVDQVATALVARLGAGLPNTLAADAAGRIKTLLAELVQDARDGLAAVLTDVLVTTTRPLDRLLGDIGVKVQRAVRDLDDALAAVRDLAAAYEALVAKFRAKVEAVSKAKLLAEFAVEESREQLSEFLISGVITNDQPAAMQTLWGTLLSGDFGAAERLLRGDSVAGFVVDRDNSWLLRRRKWQQNTGFRLTVLGFSTSIGATLAASTEVRLSGTGDVLALGIGEARSERALGGITQQAALRSAVRLLQAQGEVGASRLLQFALRIDRSYKDLDVRGLTDFLAGLRRRNLVSAAAAQGVIDELARLAAGPGSKLPFELDLTLVASDAGVARLLGLGRQLNSPAERDGVRRSIYNRTWRAIAAAGALTDNQLDAVLGVALQQVRDGIRDGLPADPTLFDILTRLADQPEFEATAALDGGLARPYNFMLHYAGGRLPDNTRVPGGIPGLIDLLGAMAGLADTPLPGDTAALTALVQKHVERIAAGAGPWMSDLVLLRSWSDLAPKLRTLLVLLAGLLDPDWSITAGQPPMLVTLQPTLGDAAPIVFA